MAPQHCWLLLLLLLHGCKRITGAASDLSPFIGCYERLSYNREDLHRKHLRARRDATSLLQLDFTAFHRTFRLQLKPDAAGFSEDFTVNTEKGSTSADLSHIYSGTLEGENASTCYGSVLQGQFEGTIHTTDGAYHVESVQRYTSSPTDHHSIIYREDDMVVPSTRTDGFCGVEHLNVFAQNLRPEEAPLSRGKRTVEESKTCCLLHFHADHLYYQRFKSVKAVVAQLWSVPACPTRLHSPRRPLLL